MVHGIVQSARPVELAPVTINGLAKPALSTTVAAQNLNSSIGIPELVYSDDNIRVLAITNDHYHFAEGSEEDIFSRSYSFRIETNTKSYVYTGDTGWSQNVIDLARNADVLVSEVIDLVGIERTLRASPNIPVAALPGLLAHMAQDHLTPQQVGEMAKAAGVKSVVLTHLVPGNDGETDPGVYSAQVSEIFEGPVSVANDLDAF
jgi:ribonuclease BN (tRNA processing enzyme)